MEEIKPSALWSGAALEAVRGDARSAVKCGAELGRMACLPPDVGRDQGVGRSL
jgi:hypothetical protein